MGANILSALRVGPARKMLSRRAMKKSPPRPIRERREFEDNQTHRFSQSVKAVPSDVVLRKDLDQPLLRRGTSEFRVWDRLARSPAPNTAQPFEENLLPLRGAKATGAYAKVLCVQEHWVFIASRFSMLVSTFCTKRAAFILQMSEIVACRNSLPPLIL